MCLAFAALVFNFSFLVKGHAFRMLDPLPSLGKCLKPNLLFPFHEANLYFRTTIRGDRKCWTAVWASNTTSPQTFRLIMCTTVSRLLTNHMELSPWDATSRSANQEFPSIWRNPNVHYRVHKSPPPVPILKQINPLNITPFCLSKINFSIILPPTSRFS
jgi:hypothetical protein